MKDQKAVTPNRRKYDEDFKQSTMKIIDNGQSVRSVAKSAALTKGSLIGGKNLPPTTALLISKKSRRYVPVFAK